MSGFLVLAAMLGLIAMFYFLRYIGAIVHEFTHALTALAYGEKIKSITMGEGNSPIFSFFSERLGEVSFTRGYGGLIMYASAYPEWIWHKKILFGFLAPFSSFMLGVVLVWASGIFSAHGLLFLLGYFLFGFVFAVPVLLVKLQIISGLFAWAFESLVCAKNVLQIFFCAIGFYEIMVARACIRVSQDKKTGVFSDGAMVQNGIASKVGKNKLYPLLDYWGIVSSVAFLAGAAFLAYKITIQLLQ